MVDTPRYLFSARVSVNWNPIMIILNIAKHILANIVATPNSVLNYTACVIPKENLKPGHEFTINAPYITLTGELRRMRRQQYLYKYFLFHTGVTWLDVAL